MTNFLQPQPDNHPFVRNAAKEQPMAASSITKKLLIKPGHRIVVVNAQPDYAAVQAVPRTVERSRMKVNTKRFTSRLSLG